MYIYIYYVVLRNTSNDRYNCLKNRLYLIIYYSWWSRVCELSLACIFDNYIIYMYVIDIFINILFAVLIRIPVLENNFTHVQKCTLRFRSKTAKIIQTRCKSDLWKRNSTWIFVRWFNIFETNLFKSFIYQQLFSAA